MAAKARDTLGLIDPQTALRLVPLRIDICQRDQYYFRAEHEFGHVRDAIEIDIFRSMQDAESIQCFAALQFLRRDWGREPTHTLIDGTNLLWVSQVWKLKLGRVFRTRNFGRRCSMHRRSAPLCGCLGRGAVGSGAVLSIVVRGGYGPEVIQ